MSDRFNDAEALKQVAVNLFYGWGYNFYRAENHLRADDLMLRAKVGWLLGQARAGVERAQSEWRREHLGAPTREKPFPDAKALDGARKLETLSRELGALEGQIRAAPAPEADRMTNRYRREAETLKRLVECDAALVGRIEVLRALVDEASADDLVYAADEIHAGLKGAARALRERQAILMGP